MKLSDPFRAAGWWFPVVDRNFELRCVCGVTQRADALRLVDVGGVTLYACKHCDTTLIGVAADDRAPTASPAPTLTPDDDDGHRMCGFVFASMVDLELWPPAADEPWMQITARPRFFSERARG